MNPDGRRWAEVSAAVRSEPWRGRRSAQESAGVRDEPWRTSSSAPHQASELRQPAYDFNSDASLNSSRKGKSSILMAM